MRGSYFLIVLGLMLLCLVLNKFKKAVRREDIGPMMWTFFVSGTVMEIWNVAGILRGHWWYGKEHLIFPNLIVTPEDLLMSYVVMPFIVVFIYKSVVKS